MKDMLKKFNTTETWIDVETLANLKGISKRAIRLSFNSKNSNYESKTIAQMLATIQKQNIDESQLDYLMMDTVVKHIGRNGIRFLKQIILMMHFIE